MENPSRVAVYNLSAVLRETGLKADLVRAWERRYQSTDSAAQWWWSPAVFYLRHRDTEVAKGQAG